MQVYFLAVMQNNNANLNIGLSHRELLKLYLIKKVFLKKKNDRTFIQLGTVHKIQNLNKKTLKIIEDQVGSLLKETDIVRYHDIYGQIK